MFWLCCLVEDVPNIASSPTATLSSPSFTPDKFIHSRTYRTPGLLSRAPSVFSPSASVSQQRSNIVGSHGVLGIWLPSRYISNSAIELKTQNDVVRFTLYKPDDVNSSKSQNKKKVKKSRSAKVNELKFYRLKAKQKMNSPNPEVRIQYKLGKVGFYCSCKF